MAARSSLVLALLPCLFLGAMAAVAVKEASQHPLTNMPPGGDITTAFFFPDHPTKHFPAGEEIKVVVGIHNDAGEPYNISSIMGSVNSAADFRTYFYNLTHQAYFQVVPQNAELAVEYKFVPHPQLPPATYTVALTVFYEGKEGFKSTTFFNQTVEIVEVKKVIDTELIMLFLLVLAVFGCAGYFVCQYLFSLGVFKSFSRKNKKVETTDSADNDDDWVKGTPYDAHRKKKAAAAAAAAAKKSS